MGNPKMAKDDIGLAKFPLAGKGGVKVRPVLLLTGPLGTVPEFLTAYISKAIPSPLLPSDLVLDPALPQYAQTNLRVASVVRLHKLATLHQRDLIRQLDTLSPSTVQEVESRLRNLLAL
jgi:mRNA interferase MazF